MLTLLFQGKRQAYQLLLSHTSRRDDVGHTRLAAGDRTRLIKRYNVHFSGFFQRNSCLEQDSVFRAHAVADYNRNRRSQSQCTRAADNQYGNTSRQCESKRLSCQQPDNRCHHCDRDNRRDKHAGNPICNLGDRRFRRRRVADHADDLRQGGIFTDSGRLTAQITRLVDRCRRNRVTLCLIHRNTLAGQCCLVDRACSFQDHTVHRDIFTWAYNKYITLLYLVNRNLCFHSIPDDNSCLRCQFHQSL